jgi:hypothetical protein
VRTPVPSFDVATLAYVAGLFDGEGSIVIGYNKPDATRGRKVPSYWLQVGITNTDRPLIDWLHATFDGHISDNSHSPSRKNQRPCWVWRTMGTQARAFLQDISPYLRIKKDQALLAIEFQDHIDTPGFAKRKDLTPEILEKREAYRQKLRQMTLGSQGL